MTQIINELTPAQRALLHTALLHFKENSEEAFALSVIEDSSPLYKAFYQYTTTEIKNLMQLLFADCFVEDMDFVQQFNKQRLSALNPINSLVIDGFL